ncbi:hypothetical protein ACFE04_022471 [Oxalis oulophora]
MPSSSHSSVATEVSAGRLEEAEREIAKDGFLLHLGGKLKFNDEEKTAEYVGGGRHFFPVRPDEMSMNYLKTYIVMPLIEDKCVAMYTEEAMIKMRSEDPRNKGKAVADDESAEQAESKAGFEGDDENDGGSDEDDLDGVSFCSEGEDEEFKELIQNAKNFTESESYYEPVLEQIRDKVAADKGATEGYQTGNESDGNYSVETNYMDDPNLNWSMSDNDEGVDGPNGGDKPANIEGNDNGADSDGWEPMNVEGTRRDSKKIYFDPSRPKLELKMIFKDNKQFKSAPQCPLKNKQDKSKTTAVEANEQSGGSNKKRKARVKDSRHAKEDIIDMTRDEVPCTPRQNEPSPKKTRLFIGSTEVQFNTKIRSPRKPRKEAPNAILEIGQPHNGQHEDVNGKKMWLERQYSRLMNDEEIIPTRKITEIHPQFRIGSNLVKKRKPTT